VVTPLLPHLLPFAIGAAGGFVGALLGLGGGIIVVPLLTLVLGIPLHSAVGTSLLAVVATSVAGSAKYLEQGLVDLRLAITLQSALVMGAVAGAVAAPHVPARWLALLFSLVMVWASLQLFRPGVAGEEAPPRVRSGAPVYRLRGLPEGLGASGLAGLLSGLLGVGGGIITIPVMILRMGVPTRVALATSSFMIGLTAAASALVTAMHGTIPLRLAAAVVLGVLAGASGGSRLARHFSAGRLRQLVALVMIWAAIQLVLRKVMS
jgi:uncharacterized membrane protein YfcA